MPLALVVHLLRSLRNGTPDPWVADVVKRAAMRQYDRQRRRQDRTHRHVCDHHDVDPDHDVVAHMYGSEDTRSSAYIHSVPRLRRLPLISTATRDEGVGPQVAFRSYDAARTHDDASKMGNVEARTNVGCRCDRDTSQNLDRPSSQVVQDATPPSFQSPLLVRPMPEPVRSSGKDPRLRCQYDRQRTPAVPAVRVVEVPLHVGAEQRANVVETLRAAFPMLIGVQSLHGTVLSFRHNHCNQHVDELRTTPARRSLIGSAIGLDDASSVA